MQRTRYRIYVCREMQGIWCLELYGADHPDDSIECIRDCTLQRGMREMRDYAYTHCRVRVLRIDQEGLPSRIVRLRSSPQRRAEMGRLRREKRVRHRRAVEEVARGVRRLAETREQHAQVAAMVDRLIAAPAPGDIESFGGLWRSVTGYGPRDYSLRDLLASAKTALVEHSVAAAMRHGWPHGFSWDPAVLNGYSRVVYIDTPEGQMSYHVHHSSYTHLPQYAGTWSGRHDSLSILGRLAGQGLV